MKAQIRRFKQRRRLARLHRDGIRARDVGHTAMLGTEGGVWTVLPERLSSDSVVYSVGVGRDLSFDVDLVSRFGAHVHAFDPTPRSIAWVRTQSLPDRLTFHDYGLAATDGTISFFPPRRETSAHFTPVKRYTNTNDSDAVEAPVKRLQTIMSELGHEHLDVLKMDIEGGEYDVLKDMVGTTVRPQQLLIEFHHGYPTISYTATRDAIHALQQVGYRVFYISPRTYEFSLVYQST